MSRIIRLQIDTPDEDSDPETESCVDTLIKNIRSRRIQRIAETCCGGTGTWVVVHPDQSFSEIVLFEFKGVESTEPNDLWVCNFCSNENNRRELARLLATRSGDESTVKGPLMEYRTHFEFTEQV